MDILVTGGAGTWSKIYALILLIDLVFEKSNSENYFCIKFSIKKGFIGSHTVVELLLSGHTVTVIDDCSNTSKCIYLVHIAII